MDKEKNKNNINFHYMNNSNNKIEPNKKEITYTESIENTNIVKENTESNTNQTEKENEKEEKSTKTNTSIFTKVPSLEELKMKYGININNKPNSIKEITLETNMSKFNKNKDDSKDKEKDINQNNFITDNNDIINLLNKKNENNILNKENQELKENNEIQNFEIDNSNDINSENVNDSINYKISNKNNDNANNKINYNINNTNNDNFNDNDLYKKIKNLNNKKDLELEILDSNKKGNNLNINNKNDLDIFNSNKKIDDISNIKLNNYEISGKKNEDNKYDFINILNLKKDTEEEIKNIFKRRDILDLSSDDSERNNNKENSNDEIKINDINKINDDNNINNINDDNNINNLNDDNNINNINNINDSNNINNLNNKNSKLNNIINNISNKKNENKIYGKSIINKDDEEEEIEMINKYINDNKITNNNVNNISILKNNINFNNNNNISCFSNISNINSNINSNFNSNFNNNQDFQKQLDKKEIKDLKENSITKKINAENIVNQTNNNILNNNLINNNLINIENDNKGPLVTNESPIKTNNINTNINNNNINNNINITNINNTSALDTSMLNSKLDQQIKLINEKSEDNRIQEEKNQQKLKEIENSLQLDKRLTHQNREIRKNAIKELCEMCTNFNSDEDDKQKAFECFSPWVKYCLEETNSYVIPESLNFFILFNSLFPHFLSTSMKDFFDNIERYVNFGISAINENCFKIFFLIIQDKKLFSQSLNEIIKLLNTSYIKMVKFLNGLLVTLIDNNIIPENYIKILFEKLIHIYIKMGFKLTEKKKIYSKLLIFIYNNIEDDYNSCIKNNIKLKSYKELDTLFNKIKKNKKNYKYRLYPKNENNSIENNNNEVSQINNNNNNNNFNEKNLRNKTPERKNNNENKEKNNLDNLILNNNSPDVNDILSILPNEFFEYHFLTQFQTKIKLLEDTNNILNKIKNVKDKEKNLVDVYKTINYSIEDSNILIHLEGIKLLENICRLVQNFINIQKLKLLLETCFDKLKDKKSLVKNELFTLFNMIIENHCFEVDKFIIFILQFCSNQKKENAQVKMGLLEYIKILFSQENNVLYYEIKKIKEKEFFNFTKKVVAIIQKESLSSIKDLCSDLLIIFKRRVEDIDYFYELISELPNYRKKIIREEGASEVEEGDYKKSLKRIKSSYSFSKTKYSSGFRGNNNNNNRDIRHERNKSNIRSNNFERQNSCSKINTSFSTGKNIKVKNNLNSKNNNINNNGNKSKNNTRTNFRNNPKSQTGGLAKFNPKRVPSSSNLHNPMTSNKKNKNNNLKFNKNDYSKSKNFNNYNTENNNNDNNSKEDNNYENNNINDNDYYKELNTNNNNNKVKKSNKQEVDEDFNKKKENLLDNIHNLDINSIDKYSKIIIKDFIIFVKKICSSEDKKKEDLSYHFNIIFMIFEKILYRLIVLLNENQEQKEKYTKLKKLLEELIGYISKIIIITPCIDQIKGSKKFDNTLLETFMEKIKEFCLNKEKFYMHLLLSLYKFCQKDEEFPKELNPKPAAVYFLKYLKDGYLETKSERLLNVLKEFISETNLLNLEEKKKLIINNADIGISNNEEKNIEDSFNQNMDEPNEEENNINNNQNNDFENGEKEENNNIDNNKNENNMNYNNIKNDEEEIEMYNNKIKKDILNINIDETDVNKYNNINNNSIALKLKEFEAKLNKIPKQEIEKETTTITGSENKQTRDEQNSINISDNYKYKKSNITPLDINYSNNKNSSGLGEKEEKDDIDANINNNVNKSKIKDNDFQKIEESIRLMSKRLDKTLNKMNEASNRNNLRKANLLTNNSITSQQGNINNINSLNISKISEKNNNNDDMSIMTSESYFNNKLNFNSNTNNNKNDNNYNNKEIIEQIISVVKGETKNNNIYQTAKTHFQNLTSIEEKLAFIKNLRNYLENPNFLSQIPINSCTNLFDFILSILSYQILNQSNNEQIIVNLQGIAEYLLPYRQLNDMFKIMLFLLKKYFPKNLNNKIEDISLVMIKVISYLLKELLKKMNKENIVGKEIICEINDLFTVTPPSTLTTATPNALFYQHIFTLLKSITDQIVYYNKRELTNIIQYLQENKIVCEDYIQYLIRLQKTC